jgi:ABC-type multidrug transport system fused ATPase/permease subunit
VLEKGEIAEQSTHEELMKNPEGIYRNFWEMQRAIEKIR